MDLLTYRWHKKILAQNGNKSMVTQILFFHLQQNLIHVRPKWKQTSVLHRHADSIYGQRKHLTMLFCEYFVSNQGARVPQCTCPEYPDMSSLALTAASGPDSGWKQPVLRNMYYTLLIRRKGKIWFKGKTKSDANEKQRKLKIKN